LCKNVDIKDVIFLGEQIITSRFPLYGDYSTPRTPIDLCYCNHCGLLQLRQTTFSSELYEHEYGYRSGISNTMRQHLKEYSGEIVSKVILQENDVILDIGSNDSTMLQYYPTNYRRIGVDPTGSQFKEYYPEDIELLSDYFTATNFQRAFGINTKCKIVSSISMFYDLPDPVQFAKDIYDILDTDGIWTCEQSYVVTMLKTNSIDTICHEHLEYYALRQIKEIADRANLKIIDVRFNTCNGGSFRIYMAKRDSAHTENIDLITSILKDEDDFGLFQPNGGTVFTQFIQNCNEEVKKLRTFIDTVNKSGKKTYVYGASTKGNCLLQYANLGETDMKYAVERNPKKIGKMTNTGIEIIGEETMRESPPDCLLVLPWHFRDEIVDRESAFLEGGGRLIFPFPHFEIVAKKKQKCLITGCEGMLAHYVKQQFVKDYLLYGITRTISKVDPETDIIKFMMDMQDTKQLEHIISCVKPDVIIHLASISSSQDAFDKPIETLSINGMLTAQLCEIIHRNKWRIKLFNASSSEIYKGHVDYMVKEDDANMHHIHPYSIAKIMGHSMVDFYRTTYGLPFSNGIIFTTEASRKKTVFLLNKVAKHIKTWLSGIKEPLILGPLHSSRNILHASDVASAIKTIISREHGENYLICNQQSFLMYDLVLALYKKADIILEIREQDETLYDQDGNCVVQINKNSELNIDDRPINIRGIPSKLLSLEWKPIVQIGQILDELLDA